MILSLSCMKDGKKILVNSENVKLWEPVDGGTHIIFGADIGRMVSESYDSISNILRAKAPAQPQPK